SYDPSRPLPDLRSFPTRRSSDLLTTRMGTVATAERSAAVRATVRRVGLTKLVDRSLPPNWATESEVKPVPFTVTVEPGVPRMPTDRKSTRLNSSHGSISYAVFCL